MNQLDELKQRFAEGVHRFEDRKEGYIRYDVFMHNNKLYIKKGYLYFTPYRQIKPKLHEVDFIYKYGKYTFAEIYKWLDENKRVEII